MPRLRWPRSPLAQNRKEQVASYCDLLFRFYTFYTRELLSATTSTATSSTLDNHSFADTLLDFNELLCRTLNDRSLEPLTRADKPPDGDKQGHAQHCHRCVVKGSKGADTSSKRCRIDGRQHKQHRDEHNPDHSDPANRPAPSSQVPYSTLEIWRKLAQENWYRIGDIKADSGNRSDRHVGCTAYV